MSHHYNIQVPTNISHLLLIAFRTAVLPLCCICWTFSRVHLRWLTENSGPSTKWRPHRHLLLYRWWLPEVMIPIRVSSIAMLQTTAIAPNSKSSYLLRRHCCSPERSCLHPPRCRRTIFSHLTARFFVLCDLLLPATDPLLPARLRCFPLTSRPMLGAPAPPQRIAVTPFVLALTRLYTDPNSGALVSFLYSTLTVHCVCALPTACSTLLTHRPHSA